jgi:hypothetical protein
MKLSLYLINYALCHDDVWGSGDISPTILDLGTKWSWVVSFTFYLRGKSPRYPLDRRPDGPQSGSGPCGEEKNFSSIRKSKPGSPAISPPLCRLSTNYKVPRAILDRLSVVSSVLGPVQTGRCIECVSEGSDLWNASTCDLLTWKTNGTTIDIHVFRYQTRR